MYGRPPVSVVVPFHGDAADALALTTALGHLRLREGDEVVIADNTPSQVAKDVARRTGFVVAAAPRTASSYYARNVGAAVADNEWLLFMDADCRPSSTLIDDYFVEAPSDAVGAVAGSVSGASTQTGLVPAYSRSRQMLDQGVGMAHPYRPFAVTANLLVRREAWRAVGGFLEGIRSGGDTDFCWRMQDAGWGIAYNHAAAVEHLHRETLRALVRQQVRYGAGCAWLNRRYGGRFRRVRPIRRLVRGVGGAAVRVARGQRRTARFNMIDTVLTAADCAGYVLGNVPPGGVGGGGGVVVLSDFFPKLSETFVVGEVRGLAAAGLGVRVESVSHPERPALGAARGVKVSYLEDEGWLVRLLAMGWLVGRHPVGVVRDVVAQRRWRVEEEVVPLSRLAAAARRLATGGEPHLHAHFAAISALNALRLGRLLGVSFSVTAHAYDIFMTPANLREKLEEAAFVTTGCRYNVEYLRSVVAESHHDRIHEVVMGVDGDQFARRSPYPGGRTVVAVGRLVAKKGFGDLVTAVSLLETDAPLERLVIVGEGPLRGELEVLAKRLGVAGRVEFVGGLEPDGVREVLEQADLLVSPSVVAADGDRDSMPVVVKEALAMQVPVVATEEVGLPELIRREFGRLVPPHDPQALARAIAEVLDLSADQRQAMGTAGRNHVLQHANQATETHRLTRLLQRVQAPTSSR